MSFWILEWSLVYFGLQESRMTYILVPLVNWKRIFSYESRRHSWFLYAVKMITEAQCEICCSMCTRGGHSARSLRSILQGVFEDILDSWMDYRWLWISRIKYINIKEALWKISRSLVHWEKKLFLWVSRASSKESWKTFFIPEWSQMTLDIRNDTYKHKGSSLQNFIPICALEEDVLHWDSRVSSKDS